MNVIAGILGVGALVAMAVWPVALYCSEPQPIPTVVAVDAGPAGGIVTSPSFGPSGGE